MRPINRMSEGRRKTTTSYLPSSRIKRKGIQGQVSSSFLTVPEGKGVYRVQSGSVSSERKSLPRLLVKKGRE